MRGAFCLPARSAAVCAWAQTKPVALPAVQTPAPKAAKRQPPKPPAQQSSAPQSDAPAARQPNSTEIQSAMAESLAKQRVAAMLQIASVMGKAPTPAASFFTVPWIETPVPFSQPPCDPLPAAELDKLVEDGAKQEGLKPDLIRGVINQESGGRPCAVSWKGAQGLMQLDARHFGGTWREGPV